MNNKPSKEAPELDDRDLEIGTRHPPVELEDEETRRVASHDADADDEVELDDDDLHEADEDLDEPRDAK